MRKGRDMTMLTTVYKYIGLLQCHVCLAISYLEMRCFQCIGTVHELMLLGEGPDANKCGLWLKIKHPLFIFASGPLTK